MTDDQNNSPAANENEEQAAAAEETTTEAEGLGEAFAEAAEEAQATVKIDEVSQLKEQLAGAENRVLLAQADLENFRKRIRREMEDATKFADIPLMADLMPVLDNLNRAIDSIDESEKSSGLAEGVKMVINQFMDVLSRRGCKQIEATGQPFDPNLHEAILHQPNADVPPETVIMETQAGYILNDRVIRPAQVIVSKQVEEPATEAEATTEDSEQ